MRRLLVCIIALAACEKTDPLFCERHVGACDDAGNFIMDASTTVTVSGTVSGLNGASGLVLQNNGTDDKPVVSDGQFRFATPVMIGSQYNVTVSVFPTNPSENCTVTNGSGTAPTTDVTNVEIQCAPASYKIGGKVQNTSSSVTLQNNGMETISVGNGNFQFMTAVQSGMTYSVQRTGGDSNCAVFGGTGTVGDADVTSIVVNCSGAGGPYAIGGTITGLAGTVTLKNTVNNDTVMITSSMTATYAFGMLVPSAGAYNVVVQTQPAYPPHNQSCTVSNGSGNAGGNVQNINVNCTTNAFTVGGSVSGIQGGTVIIQNNLTDNKSLTSSDTSYTFGSSIFSGNPFGVTVYQKPASLSCSLSTPSSGTVGNSNVTVNLTCSYMDPGILCGSGNYCAKTAECCDPLGTPTCQSRTTSCGSAILTCDSTADCTNGNSCCVQTSGGSGKLNGASCVTNGQCSSGVLLCDPGATTPCPSGTGSCSASTGTPPLYGGYPYCH